MEAELLPRLPQSPDPVGLCVSDPAVCGPSSPSTHSVSVLSPNPGAPSSVTAHEPRPGELSFLRKGEEGGVHPCFGGVHPCFSTKNRRNWGLLLLPYLEKGQWWNYPSPWIKTAPGLKGARVQTPTSSKESFTCQKCSLFSVGRRNIRLRNVSAPFPAHT